MTVVRGARPRATKALHWAAGPVSFELTSPDPDALDRARAVFGPWLNGSPGSSPPKIRFRVQEEVTSTGERWMVQREGHEPTTATSLDLALATVEYGAIAALHESDSGMVAVHAALLSKRGRGVLVVGPKEAGKSTLSCALWATGWRLHSDDNALIEPRARARGIPRRVSLRETSHELVGPDLWERALRLPGTTRTCAGILFHPEQMNSGTVSPSVPVAGILFLARRGSTAGPGRLEPLDAPRALLALAPYCNRRNEGFGAALQALQPLADRAQAFDLGRGDLAAMIRRTEEAITA